ncbi:MAG: hypothetical protein EOP04_21470 [Proteobacteria bacterium]|nr:MAG: hypothetical protein EOP04_21470 [Pseudomonadota bacterium]
MKQLKRLLFALTILSTNTAFANTSYDNREAGKFSLGLGLGVFMAPVSGASLSGTYNYTPDVQFELRAASGSIDADDLIDSSYNDIVVNRFDLDANLTEIRAKYFVGNSFYVAGGLAQRTLQIDIDARDQDSAITGNLKSASTCFTLAIGNIWNLDNGMYIGGEWLALAVPMSSSSSNHFNAQGITDSDTESLKRDTKKAMNDIGKTTTAGVATFQIGYQF